MTVRPRVVLAVVAAFVAGAALATLVAQRGIPAIDDPTAPEPSPTAAEVVPADILDLTNWKLTLPVGDEEDEASEVGQPELAKFHDSRFFHVDEQRTGVVFRADVGGATTSGSEYPRTELREMTADGRKPAKWSNRSGTHVLTVTQAITATPQEKPDVAVTQIHDGEDDLLVVRLEGKRLFVEVGDGDRDLLLDPKYRLGTRFAIEVAATPAGITVTYNGTRTVRYKEVNKNMYFKAGCYTQSNEDEGEPADSHGEVVIYSLSVTHS